MNSTVDWGLIKLQYEVFGLSREEILEDGQVSATQLDYAIEEQGWRRMPTACALQDYRDLGDLEQVGTDLIEEVQNRLRTLRTIKQAVLSPRYIALETAILGKALDTIQTIDPATPQAAGQIKVLTEVLSSLKEQNQMVGPAASGEGEGGGGMTVKIMTQVGQQGQVCSGAEVKINQGQKKELAH